MVETKTIAIFTAIFIIGIILFSNQQLDIFSTVPLDTEKHFGVPILEVVPDDDKFIKDNIIGGSIAMSCPVCVPEDDLGSGDYVPPSISLDGIKLATCSVNSCESIDSGADNKQILELAKQQVNMTGIFFEISSSLLKDLTISGPGHSLTFFQKVECTSDVHCIDRIRLEQLVCYEPANRCVSPRILVQLTSSLTQEQAENIIEDSTDDEEEKGKSNTVLFLALLAVIGGAGFYIFKFK